MNAQSEGTPSKDRIQASEDKVARMLEAFSAELEKYQPENSPFLDIRVIATLTREIKSEQNRIQQKLDSLISSVAGLATTQQVTTSQTNVVKDLRWWVGCGAFVTLVLTAAVVAAILASLLSDSTGPRTAGQAPQVFVLPAAQTVPVQPQAPVAPVQPQQAEPAPQNPPG